MEWINVHDSMPTQRCPDFEYLSVWVLVVSRGYGVTIGMYDFEEKYWDVTIGDYWTDDEVTHWMPMPGQP